jgi:hypothetical protein
MAASRKALASNASIFCLSQRKSAMRFSFSVVRDSAFPSRVSPGVSAENRSFTAPASTEEVKKSMILRKILNTGVGRPPDCTPSH